MKSGHAVIQASMDTLTAQIHSNGIFTLMILVMTESISHGIHLRT